MTDRIITADADKVSPAEFYRAVFGIPEPTEEDIAARKVAADEHFAEVRRRREELGEIYRQAVAEMIAKRNAQVELEAKPVGDPLLKRFAA